MNLLNLSVLVLTFVAPVAAVLFTARRSARAAGGEFQLRGCAILFGLAMVAAATGVWRFDKSIRMEFLWPLTLEQSGYFEFTLQLLWSRFVWIFFVASMLLGFAAFDGAADSREDR